jgi:hypothetical protein
MTVGKLRTAGRATLVLLLAASATACATRAGSVAPVAVSAGDYGNMNCAAAREELVMAREKQNSLARRQNTAAAVDAAAVWFVLLPLGSVFGADVSGELAQAKGETLALERHIKSGCQTAQPGSAVVSQIGGYPQSSYQPSYQPRYAPNPYQPVQYQALPYPSAPAPAPAAGR